MVGYLIKTRRAHFSQSRISGDLFRAVNMSYFDLVEFTDRLTI